MEIAISQDSQKVHHQSIALKVRYVAARKPYVDPHALLGETLVLLKPRVLEFFGLSEGTVDGGTKIYCFALNGIVQTNLAVELGSLADGNPDLKLDLIERFEQG